MNLDFVKECCVWLEDDKSQKINISHGKIIDLCSMRNNTISNIVGNDFRITIQKNDIKTEEFDEYFYRNRMRNSTVTCKSY